MMRSVFVVLAAILSLGAAPARAEYPERPIRLIVPYAAGGGADSAARIVAQQMGEKLGQQVVIENRTGAGGVLAADAAATAAPDGYTALFSASEFAANPALRKLPYDPRADFIPLSLVVIAPNILVVGPQAPYATVPAFLDYARKNPGKLTYASAGPGSGSHLGGEALNAAAGIDLLHVPYRGGAPALNDLMAGRVSAYFANTATAMGQVAAGSIRALATGSPGRSRVLPDLPTIAETLPGFESQEWNAMYLPKGTPAPIVERLSREVAAAVADPAVRAKLEALGLEPVGNGPAEFGRFLDDELARAAATVKARNIRVD